jgi:phospholipid/cholesterol/gamma-HCH transport system substrate-binding protein
LQVIPHRGVRPLVGVATVVIIAGIFLVAANLFRGSYTDTVPVTLLTPRAGLMMYEGAKVQMRGVQVGKVASIEALPAGGAAIHLAMDPSQLDLIPANVSADIASTTVFGAKFVQLLPPANPSPENIHAGQVLRGEHVTVEINTIFQHLTSVLSKIEPEKLNQSLGAIASAFKGRGERLGRTLDDLNSYLAKLDPSLPNLNHDIAAAPAVASAYADVGPDLVEVVDNASQLSKSIVEEQQNLDAFLVSVIGLADAGNDVVGGNRQALTDVVHLLVPTTDLSNRYNEALWCSISGLLPLVHSPPGPFPAITVSVNFTAGVERYRYPQDLPKVGATGGPHCKDMGLPNIPFESKPPFLVTDIGNNPWAYGNQGVILNSDGLKQFLFGPIDGPPRNTEQFGQPG